MARRCNQERKIDRRIALTVGHFVTQFGITYKAAPKEHIGSRIGNAKVELQLGKRVSGLRTKEEPTAIGKLMAGQSIRGIY